MWRPVKTDSNHQVYATKAFIDIGYWEFSPMHVLVVRGTPYILARCTKATRNRLFDETRFLSRGSQHKRAADLQLIVLWNMPHFSISFFNNSNLSAVALMP